MAISKFNPSWKRRRRSSVAAAAAEGDEGPAGAPVRVHETPGEAHASHPGGGPTPHGKNTGREEKEETLAFGETKKQSRIKWKDADNLKQIQNPTTETTNVQYVQNEDTAENHYDENSKKSSIYLPVSTTYEETTINKKPKRRKRRRSSSTSPTKKRRKSQEVKAIVLNDKITEEDSKKANSVDEKPSKQQTKNKQEKSGAERSQLRKFKTPLLLNKLQLTQQHPLLHQKSSILCQLMQQHPLLHHKSSILCATLQRLEHLTAN